MLAVEQEEVEEAPFFHQSFSSLCPHERQQQRFLWGCCCSWNTSKAAIVLALRVKPCRGSLLARSDHATSSQLARFFSSWAMPARWLQLLHVNTLSHIVNVVFSSSALFLLPLAFATLLLLLQFNVRHSLVRAFDPWLFFPDRRPNSIFINESCVVCAWHREGEKYFCEWVGYGGQLARAVCPCCMESMCCCYYWTGNVFVRKRRERRSYELSSRYWHPIVNLFVVGRVQKETPRVYRSWRDFRGKTREVRFWVFATAIFFCLFRSVFFQPSEKKKEKQEC